MDSRLGGHDAAALLILRGVDGGGTVQIGGRRYALGWETTFRLTDLGSGRVLECSGGAGLLDTALSLLRQGAETGGAAGS
ncbi:MAG TPA: hypothetical protein VJV23_06035 [Candidatus Polarisedimenticolia bacterium]|nr:hypothetical protein [Candidatus Polarisedimenticolia bacterium]